MEKTKIKIETQIAAPVEKVWEFWTEPQHIKNWTFASDDWHVPSAENDLRNGGSFSTRMEAKSGSMGFDFSGIYEKVIINKRIAYTLGDGRKVAIYFEDLAGQTKVSETFEAEDTNPIDMQRSGWQSILDHFKKYAENN